MNPRLSRRAWIEAVGITGAAAAAGVLGTSPPASVANADQAADRPAAAPAVLRDGHVIQPQRELPLLHQTDVLVVGGGPAGVCAALAARRTGAKVALVERYGHFGGQWTGGLVLIVAGMHDNTNTQVSRGVGEEILARLDKIDRGVMPRRPGVDPTIDAEAAKYVMVEMLTEAQVDVFLHCWGVDAIVEGNVVKGAVFESKSGRQAILAKTVVDASGDGDIFAAAGAQFDQIPFHIGLVCRLGNLDKVDREKAKVAGKKLRLGASTPIEGVRWVNMSGPPEQNCLDVAALSKLEMSHRRFIWRQVEEIRKTPGYEQVYLLETAPQLGVRMSRMLEGTQKISLEDTMAGKTYRDVIGVGGDWRKPEKRIGPWQIPYGALVPKTMENILAAGRCVCGDRRLADHLRVIPTCFVTGHAAGVAAALAVIDRCPLRSVEVPKLQKILKEQGAYLGANA